MPKKIEDMLVPDRRRSIRDIPVPESRRKHLKVTLPKAEAEMEAGTEDELPPVRMPIPRHRRGSRKRIFLAGTLALGALLFGILSLFNGATFSYAPKSSALAFANDVYSAHKSGNNGLFYSVVKLSREKGLQAPAGSEQEVSRKASGMITVYNTSSETQRLVATTRFETPDGKIYRIDKPITVPANGSVDATIYADQAGENYNGSPTDFTLPGLKGTPRFETVYARSKTPLAGGFVGREKVVSPEDLSKTRAALQGALMDDLYKEAEAEVPEDFILFRALSVFSFEEMPSTQGSGQNVTVNMRGHLYGVMFKKSDLASFLAQKKLNIVASEPVSIPEIGSLSISFASAPPSDLLSSSEVSFKVNGDTRLEWITDEVALKSDLAGKGKKEIPAILNNYPTVASANATIRPFWKTSMPDKPEKIRITKLSAE